MSLYVVLVTNRQTSIAAGGINKQIVQKDRVV